jgi:hypothetical protein
MGFEDICCGKDLPPPEFFYKGKESSATFSAFRDAAWWATFSLGVFSKFPKNPDAFYQAQKALRWMRFLLDQHESFTKFGRFLDPNRKDVFGYPPEFQQYVTRSAGDGQPVPKKNHNIRSRQRGFDEDEAVEVNLTAPFLVPLTLDEERIFARLKRPTPEDVDVQESIPGPKGLVLPSFPDRFLIRLYPEWRSLFMRGKPIPHASAFNFHGKDPSGTKKTCLKNLLRDLVRYCNDPTVLWLESLELTLNAYSNLVRHDRAAWWVQAREDLRKSKYEAGALSAGRKRHSPENESPGTRQKKK